jgi:outer membrane lipoprotein-sorting protein
VGRRWVMLLVFVVVACSGVSLAGEAGPVPLDAVKREALLQRIRDVQSGIRTMQAPFTEDRSLAGLAVPLHFEGVLYVERGGLLFMEYRHPLEHILQVKGDSVLFYVKGSTTADLVDLSQVQGIAGRPDVFAWNPGDFRGEIYEEPDAYRLEDRGKAGEGRRITVFLDRETLLVCAIDLTEKGGDRTHIALGGLEVNRPLPQRITDFQLPEGTGINALGGP